MRGVQADLGGFDPRFLGITIRFDSLEMWERFGNKQLPVDAVHLAKLPDIESFRLVSETTVVEHELRHFHDFFLSPYSQYILRMKLQALVNGFQVLSMLFSSAHRGKADCIPIPVSQWCRMSPEKRQLQIERWNRGPKKASSDLGWIPPDMPLLPEDLDDIVLQSGTSLPDGAEALRMSLVATIRAYDNIDRLLHNPQTANAQNPIQPWHVMELSALIVQIQQVYRAYGVETTQSFTGALENSGFPKSTVRLFRLLQTPWHDRGCQPDLGSLAAVVTWTLLGNYGIDGWKACPTIRIAWLVNALHERGPPNINVPVRGMFEEWSQLTNLSNPFDNLRDNVRRNYALLAKYRDLFRNSRGTRLTQEDNVLAASETLCAVSAQMFDAFNADPDAYVRPERYLEEMERYVRPPLRCEFEGFRVRAMECDAAARSEGYEFGHNWHVMFTEQDVEGHRLMRTGAVNLSASGSSAIDNKTAATIYLSLLCNDYIFQPHNRLDWEFDLARRALPGDSGLIPLNVMR